MKLYFTSQLVCAKPVRLILLSTNKEDVESRRWRGAMCMHACVWRVYVLALCDSQLHPTSSNKVKRAFISAPDSPPGATGIRVLHTRMNAARAAQQHAAQILRMHWLTAAIKPVCGEQTESFYVGLNKTKILLRISARARVYVLVHVQRALQLQWSLPTLFTLSEAEKRSSQHDLHQHSSHQELWDTFTHFSFLCLCL